MGPLKKLLILVQRPQYKGTSDSLRAPKIIILALFLKNLAILRNATFFQGLD